jgi:hypothetical protein
VAKKPGLMRGQIMNVEFSRCELGFIYGVLCEKLKNSDSKSRSHHLLIFLVDTVNTYLVEGSQNEGGV